MSKQSTPTTARLQEIEREMADLTEQRTQLRSHWQLEKKLIQSIRAKKQELEQARIDAERFEREGDFAKVAELRYGTTVTLEKSIKDSQEELERLQRDKQML